MPWFPVFHHPIRVGDCRTARASTGTPNLMSGTLKSSQGSKLELMSQGSTQGFGSEDSFNEFANYPVMSPNGPLHHRDRQYSKRMRRRLVYKNGEVNISHSNIKKRKRRYLADIFTTLVDIKWRWNLLLFIAAFILSWLIFAMIWWLICFSHGDFENAGKPNWEPCVNDVFDFTTALLFSIETQHTIGYGSRHTTPNCPEAILVMMMQSCCGVIIQALMTGLVFAKLSRPKKRAETLMFSKNAVVCKRDGVMCLLFRVGDMRKSHIIEAHTRGVLIRKKITREGEVLPLEQVDVDFGFNEGRDRLFLVWPVIVEHRITDESPFYEMSMEDFQREQFEVIVILEGIVESTGMTTQARSSYLPGEILWGHRFERLVTFQKENGEYQIDYSRFHSAKQVDMPQCSAKELELEGDHFVEGETVVMDDDSSSIASRPGQKSPYVLKRNGATQANIGINDSDRVQQRKMGAKGDADNEEEKEKDAKQVT
ncbi:G protein-activated inward rectifier potassium channel 3-like [Lineus longissimus]|uniref:G protein-activated inward rectifier potassium channel 3-like n=1 Tax=Lineus longissimus TaxID=88925 RepID=UPI002B4E019B